MMTAMSDAPATRSVKIAADERTGWSSERPRRDGEPPRAANVAVRGRVLAPTERLRYNPGSLLLIVSASPELAAALAERTVQERGVAVSPAKVRTLLAGRVPDADLPERAGELLVTAVTKRLAEGQSVALALETLEPAERERFVRLAHANRRPRHLILVETAKDQVAEEMRAPLNELRRALDAGELGGEGFETSLRLGGRAASDLKRIIFEPPPRTD
jgi:hypothetical protein